MATREGACAPRSAVVLPLRELIFNPLHGILSLVIKTSVQTVKSRGTVSAEKARAKANKFTDQKRSALLEKGMTMMNDHFFPGKNR